MKPRPVAYTLGAFALVMLGLAIWRLTATIPGIRGVSCGSALSPDKGLGLCAGSIRLARSSSAAFAIVALASGIGCLFAPSAASRTGEVPSALGG